MATHVEHYRFIDRSWNALREVVSRDATRLLQRATDEAERHVDQLMRRLSSEVGGVEVGKDVVIDVGDPERVDDRHVRIPLRWEAASQSSLFPTMDATLELIGSSSFLPERTKVLLVGDYDPPLGAVGQAIDEAALHRVAEDAVARFVDEVADDIEQATS